MVQQGRLPRPRQGPEVARWAFSLASPNLSEVMALGDSPQGFASPIAAAAVQRLEGWEQGLSPTQPMSQEGALALALAPTQLISPAAAAALAGMIAAPHDGESGGQAESRAAARLRSRSPRTPV